MLCPNQKCKEEITRLTEGRYCPHCWTELKRYKTKQGETLFVRINDDAPPTALMKHWMDAVADRMSRDHGRKIPFTIHPMRNKNKYMAEIAMAESLLAQVNWDVELAKRSITYVVDGEYKVPITLAWVRDPFIAASFIVADRLEEENRRTSQDHTKDAVEGMEDIWS